MPNDILYNKNLPPLYGVREYTKKIGDPPWNEWVNPETGDWITSPDKEVVQSKANQLNKIYGERFEAVFKGYVEGHKPWCDTCHNGPCAANKNKGSKMTSLQLTDESILDETLDVSPAAIVKAGQQKRNNDVEQEIKKAISTFKTLLSQDPPAPEYMTTCSGTRILTYFVSRAALHDVCDVDMWEYPYSDASVELYDHLCRRVTDHFRKHGWDAFVFTTTAVDHRGRASSDYKPEDFTHRTVHLLLRLPTQSDPNTKRLK